MVFITQQIFDWQSGILEKDFTPQICHDYFAYNFHSYLVDRILNPESEHIKYLKYLEQNLCKLTPLKCKKISDNYIIDDKEFYINNSYGPYDETNCYKGEYGFKTKINDTKKFSFALGWNNNYLFSFIEVLDLKRNFGKSDTYDPYSNLILFCFNNDWNSKLSVQLKENGIHKVYFDHTEMNKIRELNNVKLHVDVDIESYYLAIAIPWSEIDLKPNTGQVVDFYFLIHTGFINELGIDALTAKKYDRKIILM